ncbi:MAG TPA: hypothetical protein VF553_21690 [Pyrinomonadaceae bacterium]|jgi:hypothetical protein
MTGNGKTDVSAAALKALGFLLDAQDSAGEWKDFLLPAGNSNVWVTGFVGGVLAALPFEKSQEAALKGWRFLEKAATADGGWSYNPSVPGDGDSTLWGLRLGETLGLESSDTFQKAYGFLERHLSEDGGLTTYASPAPVRNYIGLPPFVSFDGWTQSHVCVTAACANLSSHRQRFQQYLLQNQAEDGRWRAYWWFDDEYATAEAVAALVGDGRTSAERSTEVAAQIERAVGWALKRSEILMASEGANPPAFALAHTLRILSRALQSPLALEAVSKGTARLVEWQRADGSWAASARLRVPRPDSVSPAAGTEWKMWAGMPQVAPSLENVLKHTFDIYSPDHYGVYTTATVLRALHETSLAAN